MIDDERVQLFRLHACSLGLDEAALQEIASAAELMRCEAGDVIVDPQTPVTSIYLVIHGRVRLQLLDIQGRVAVQRF